MQFLMLGYIDPADRFLAATARAHDKTLVTADQHLLGLSGMRTCRPVTNSSAAVVAHRTFVGKNRLFADSNRPLAE